MLWKELPAYSKAHFRGTVNAIGGIRTRAEHTSEGTRITFAGLTHLGAVLSVKRTYESDHAGGRCISHIGASPTVRAGRNLTHVVAPLGYTLGYLIG